MFKYYLFSPHSPLFHLKIKFLGKKKHLTLVFKKENGTDIWYIVSR